MTCAHCEELQLELNALRRQIRQDYAANKVNQLARHFGLTRHEALILAALYGASGRVVSKNQLDLALPPTNGLDVRSWKHIDVHVCRVRSKTSKAAIETSYGMGFRLTDLGRLLCDEALEARARAA